MIKGKNNFISITCLLFIKSWVICYFFSLFQFNTVFGSNNEFAVIDEMKE